MIRYLVLVIGLLVGGIVRAADITLSVDNATPNVNDTIAITIHASIPAGESFVAANQYLAFDNTQIELTAQTAGDAGVFVADSRGLAAINATGEVRAGVHSLGGPVSGTFILGVLTFKTLAPGVTWATAVAYHAGTAPFGNLFYRAGGATVTPTTPGPLTITIGGAPLDADGDGMPDTWENTYLGGTTASPTADADLDGMNNLQEFQAGTLPNDRESVLAVVGLTGSGSTLDLKWLSVTGKKYTIQKSTNLMQGFPLTEASNIVANPPTNTYPVALGAGGSGFYRVKLETGN